MGGREGADTVVAVACCLVTDSNLVYRGSTEFLSEAVLSFLTIDLCISLLFTSDKYTLSIARDPDSVSSRSGDSYSNPVRMKRRIVPSVTID